MKARLPLGYFFYDLRWWWLGGALVLVLYQVDSLIGAPLERLLAAAARWRPSSRRLLIDAVLFTAAIACAIISTPHLRFSNQVHGDEPKYIRYCELWYQGGGFDISGKKMLADLPADSGPALQRIPGLILSSLRQDLTDLASDLPAFAASPRSFRWNRSTGEEGFVRGKNGGVYQIYQPGVSFTLFPGYFLDRFFSPRPPGYQGEFAPSLVMTNVMLLLMFGASAVALNRLLRHALASDSLAAAWAALAMVSLPTTAFAFQFYPELPGLLLILLVSIYVLFTPATTPLLLAAAAGTGAAALAWLHPRFLLVSAVLAVCGLVRSNGRGRVAFGAAAGLVYCSVFAFNYHVTGSFLPTALWDAARPDEGFAPGRVPLNLIGYALDRTWGLAPHAPILLAVVPGLVLLARQSWRHALFVTAVGLGLAIPASAHTLNAAGGTPGRLVVAVIPLLVWPVAVLVRRFWSSWTVRVLAVTAIVTSLDAGLTYNWNHHEKALGALHAAGRSGWRPNLAFPVIRDSGWESPGNFGLFLAFAGLIAIAALVSFLRSSPRGPPACRFAPDLHRRRGRRVAQRRPLDGGDGDKRRLVPRRVPPRPSHGAEYCGDGTPRARQMPTVRHVARSNVRLDEARAQPGTRDPLEPRVRSDGDPAEHRHRERRRLDRIRPDAGRLRGSVRHAVDTGRRRVARDPPVSPAGRLPRDHLVAAS